MIAEVLLQGAANVLRTAVLAWLLAVACGVGNLILTRFFPGPRDGLGELAASLGLGLGALELSVLALGAAGLLGTAPIATTLAALTGLAALAAARRLPALGRPRLPSRETSASLAVLAAGALLSWLLACAPPIFYDTLVYHFGVPNLYLLRGGVVPLPHNVYSAFPLGTEMLYLLGLALGGPRQAVLFSWAFCLLAALAVAALVRPRWGAPAAALAAALFLLAPPVLLLARLGTVEPALAFFCLLAWAGLFASQRSPTTREVVLAGVFGGLALSAKYLGGLLGVALPAAVLLARRRPADALRLAAAAALVAAPWLLKNALFTGNPVHPAFFGVFGGSGWSAAQALALEVDAKAAWRTAASALDVLGLPLGLVFGTRALGTASRWGWIWAPVFGAAAVLAVRRPTRDERLLLALFAGCLAIWAGTFWMARFLVPALGLGAAIVAAAVERLGERRRRDVGPALAAAVAVVAFLSVLADEPAREALRPALGLEAAQDYVSSKIRIAPAVAYANEHLPPDARVLLLGDAGAAYLRRDHEAATNLDRPLLPALLGRADDDAGVSAALARAGFTHVLVNLPGLLRAGRAYPAGHTPEGTLRPFLDFLARRATVLASGREVYLFALPRREPDAAPDAVGER